MALDLAAAGEGRSHTLVRAFRPTIFWAAASVLLLTYDAYLRTSLHFKVNATQETPGGAVRVKLDGQPYQIGSRIMAPGKAILEVEGTDMEPFSTNLFVWLGANRIADISLRRSTGTVEAKSDPSPEKLTIKGAFYTNIVRGPVGKFEGIPVGRYEVSADFGGSIETKVVVVDRNRTHPVEFRPMIGWIQVESSPAGAKWSMRPTDGRDGAISGESSQAARLVTAGSYHLSVWRGNYRKEMDVEIRRAETNRSVVTFEYGELKVASDPEGASVFLNDREAGRTPKSFSELEPGIYTVKLRHAGRQPVEVRLQVDGNQSVTFATNLISVTYLDSMQKARRIAESSAPDYRKGLSLIEEALQAKPGDGAALELQEKLREGLAKLEAKEAGEQAVAERQKRIRGAETEFQQATRGEKDSEFFETHLWKVQVGLEKVREALFRSVEKPPITWHLDDRRSLADGLMQYRFVGKGMIAKHKHCVILLAQIAPDELHVYAKFWDYALGNKINLNLFQGITADSMVPVHPRYFPEDQKENILTRRKAIAEEFKARLFQELNL